MNEGDRHLSNIVRYLAPAVGNADRDPSRRRRRESCWRRLPRPCEGHADISRFRCRRPRHLQQFARVRPRVHRTVRTARPSLHRVAPPAKRSAFAYWRLGDLSSQRNPPRRSEQLDIRLALAPLLHRPKGNSVKLSIWPVGAIGFASGLESRAANPQRRRTRSGGPFIREATRASQAYAPSQSQAIASDRDAIEAHFSVSRRELRQCAPPSETRNRTHAMTSECEFAGPQRVVHR